MAKKTQLILILASSILLFNSCDPSYFREFPRYLLPPPSPQFDGLVFVHDTSNGTLCDEIISLAPNGTSLCEKITKSCVCKNGVVTYQLDESILNRGDLQSGIYASKGGSNGGSSIGLNYLIPIYPNEYISKINPNLPTPSYSLRSNTKFDKTLPTIRIGIVDDSVSEEFINQIVNRTKGQVQISNESCYSDEQSDSFHGEQVTFVLIQELLDQGVKNPIEIIVIDVVEETNSIPYVSSFKLMCALNLIDSDDITYVNMSLGFKHKVPQLLNQIQAISHEREIKITASLGNDNLQLIENSCGVNDLDSILSINLPAQYSHCDLNQGVIYPVMGIEFNDNRIVEWRTDERVGTNYITGYPTYGDLASYDGIPAKYYGTSYSAPRVLAKIIARCQFTNQGIVINNQNISTSVGCIVQN